MSVQRYRKRPIEVEALKWTGDNIAELERWTRTEDDGPGVSIAAFDTLKLWVEANETWLPLEIGEWVLKDLRGFYPCKADVFEVTYEPAEPALIDFCLGEPTAIDDEALAALKAAMQDPRRHELKVLPPDATFLRRCTPEQRRSYLTEHRDEAVANGIPEALVDAMIQDAENDH